MNEIIFIGWVNQNHQAINGEDMKNQLLLEKLRQFGVKCYVADFYKWKKHPWVLLKLLYWMIFKRKATVIFSTSAINVYPMMKLMYRLKWKQNTVHWVIGGAFADNVAKGIFRADVTSYVKWTLVESAAMKDDLEKLGFKGVIQVPNFKPIDYYPDISKRKNQKIKFVFLSRIMPEKGCDYILKAAEILNEKGLKNSFEIAFFGKVDSNYKNEFARQVKELCNVSYEGFLNLRDNAGYDKLSSYDVMLFPTYWCGEGFAGVFIDAFICGLPMIISDWAHNRQFQHDGQTAIFIPVHDVKLLALAMENCVLHKYNLQAMSIASQKEALNYDVKRVVTEKLLKKIAII